MRLRSKVFVILGLLACGLKAETPGAQTPEPIPNGPKIPPALDPGQVVTMPLDEHATYMVGISPFMPTTVLLPDMPESFQGVGFTKDDAVAAPVRIDYTLGNRFFSVKPLFVGATADLNVVLHNRIYSFKFFHSEKPIRALTLFDAAKYAGRRQQTAGRGARIERLVYLIEQAKTYFVIKENYPNMYRNIEFTEPATVIPYLGFKVIVDQAFRFDDDDTIVFRVIFSNETYQPIYYGRDLAVRVGANIYDASLSDVSGEITPAKPGLIRLKTTSGRVTATLRSPDGRDTDITGLSAFPLPAPGEYRLTLRQKGHKEEIVKFQVFKIAGMTVEQSKTLTVDLRTSELASDITITQPRAGQTFGYFTITGNPDGSRAELSLKNTFNVLVRTQPAPEGQTSQQVAGVRP